MPQCQHCPAGAKVQANYPDEEGKTNRLCAEHAWRAGSHPTLLHQATSKAVAASLLAAAVVQAAGAPPSPTARREGSELPAPATPRVARVT